MTWQERSHDALQTSQPFKCSLQIGKRYDTASEWRLGILDTSSTVAEAALTRHQQMVVSQEQDQTRSPTRSM